MIWISSKIEKFRQMRNPYFALHITSRFLFGVGLGVLLATHMDWLDIHYCSFGNSYSKYHNYSSEVKRLSKNGGKNG